MSDSSLADRVFTFLGFRPVDGVAPGTVDHKLRFLAALVVSATGVVLLVPNALALAASADPLRAALAGFGTVVSLSLVLVGFLLYRSRFTPRNLLRIAAWNVLGVVVLGVVMSLHVASAGLAAGDGTFVVANLLSVGAGAHVVIGFYDVQRVRADRLARERRKLGVLARVLRHNLRNDGNVIAGHAARARERLTATADARADGGVGADLEPDDADAPLDAPETPPRSPAPAPSPDAVADALDSLAVLEERSGRLGEYAEATGRVLAAYRSPVGVDERTDLACIAREAVSSVAPAYPDATVSCEAPAELAVRGDDRLDRATRELLENACEHAGPAPTVEVSVTADADTATLAVSDDGPGIPPGELETVVGDAEITQTTHNTGLGLWTVKACVETAGGDLAVDDDGSTVRLTLPRR